MRHQSILGRLQTHRNSPKDTTMNAVRLFAFAVAVLLTAFLLRVVTYGLTVESPSAAAAPATATAPSAAATPNAATNLPSAHD
jgi:hypothetical protein